MYIWWRWIDCSYTRVVYLSFFTRLFVFNYFIFYVENKVYNTSKMAFLMKADMC